MYFISAGGQVEHVVSAHADVNGMSVVFTLWFSSPHCFKIAARGRPSLPELRFFLSFVCWFLNHNKVVFA